ncbi:putative F-box/LRR-repeat protein At5g54820 [Raphanus sativus]|uniref:F-box/LRR-repeat protein At5g54820 n=1 Tax=Raphanus sativus TaxID=3726 RepID=A0A6J0MU51_RAPSA|nr:putative F-box/LRR-repeat protein At5g54820 [Raphanus sativus]
MDPNAQPDRLSDLPDVLLVLIMSFLSFKERAQTNFLSKRWESLYLETRDLSFKESDFLTASVYANPIRWLKARADFVGYVRRLVDRIRDQPIETFGISISYPKPYLELIESLMAFAVQKRVKSLVLDFSNLVWRTYNDVNIEKLVVKIPQSVYDLTSLESLEVCACKDFDPSKLSKLGKLRSVSFGWMELTDLPPLLETSRLESLTMKECLVHDLEKISSVHLREVAIYNCDFYFMCIFNLPRVDIFKYRGDIMSFGFDQMNTIISEVELDFGAAEKKNDVSYDSYGIEAGMICEFLNNLLDEGRRTATTLTVCPFLLKVIPRSEHPHFLRPMKTKHLVLKTKLHPKEFNGIRLLLLTCPYLETLTIDLLPPSPIAVKLS